MAFTRLIWLLFFILCLTSSSVFADFWHETEGISGGMVRAIKSDPDGRLFASADSRLFRSTNGGGDWHRLNTGVFDLEGLGSIYVDSSGSLFVGHSYGVLRSTDHGETWAQTGIMSVTRGVRALTSNATGAVFAGTWREGWFRSDNFGLTWNRCSAESLTAASFYVNNVTNVILAGSEGGIYRSINGGLSWTLASIPNTYFTHFLKIEGGIIFATSSTSTAGLYKSTDEGVSWMMVNSALRYCETILRTNSGRMLVGSAWGMFASEDSGRTWTQSGLSREAVQTLWTGGGQVLAGTVGGGVFGSTNDGRTWRSSTKGIEASRIQMVAADPDGYVFAASYHNIFSSNNFGATFTRSFESSSAEVQAVAVDSRGRVYAIVMDTILASTNHGSSWQVASGTGIWQPPWVLAVDPDDNLFTVTRSAAVYRSTNQGRTWTSVRGADVSAAFGLTIGFASDGTGFLATHEPNAPYGRVFRSTDRGLTWNQIAQSIQTNGVQSFCITPAGVVFLGTNGLGVLRSTDRGTSWSEANTGLPDRWVRFLAAGGNELVVNTSSYWYPPGECTFRSTNQGESWFREASGFPNDFVTSLTAGPTGYLYAGTQIYGLYRSQRLTGVPGTRNAHEFALYQNFPNPFNPVTTITYSLREASDVRLAIFNSLGQEVSTLVNTRQGAGLHRQEWNATNTPSGVYYYRLEAGGRGQTKRLVLLR